MNKKSTLGLALFSIGTLVDCLGIIAVLLYLGADLFSNKIGSGTLLGSTAFKFAGPVTVLIGVVILVIGYAVVCKYYVARPKAKKAVTRTAPPAPPAAVPTNTPPRAPYTPSAEKTDFVSRSPLAVTKITYIF